MTNQTILETDDLAEAGHVILSHLAIARTDERYIQASRVERANYKAVQNWLISYQPYTEASNLKHMKGLLEAFHHLCSVNQWKLAAELLFLPIQVVNRPLEGAITEPLHMQLGHWGQYPIQIQLYKKLFGHSTPETDMVCLNGLGLAHQSLGNYNQAIDYHSQHLMLASQLEDLDAQQNGLCNLGNLCGLLGQYDAATTYYEQALVLARQLNDQQGEGELLGNLGVVMRSQRQFD
ncbi:tetratricopeptide repeat protein [Adonisia turfae]|uniref:Tetratricopeptide repeat protein n=1 Tax=Adonisia turfae CCMR0081 TaxID=2292702 RepID=A0A6M0RR85_9CYAN|nr:tetratricopeptide repeat protein [Adonisia turfae]NEZ58686.1 tetratricopeptide repeat protein [Adonisia turfae CCMR0081]